MDIIQLEREIQILRKILVVVFSLAYGFMLLLPARTAADKLHQTVVLRSSSTTYLPVTSDKSLVGWGDNRGGLVGNGNFEIYYPYFARKTILKNVKSVYTNDNQTAIAVDEAGGLWRWGNLPSRPGSWNRPEKLMDDVADAGLGMSHIVILKTDGTVWTQGLNGCGQLGVGDNRGRNLEPQKILDNMRAVYAFYDMSFAISNDDELYLWGYPLPIEATASPLFSPTCVATGIKEVYRAGWNRYLLLTAEGDVLWLDITDAEEVGQYSSNMILEEVYETGVSTLYQEQEINLPYRLTKAPTFLRDLFLWNFAVSIFCSMLIKYRKGPQNIV
jgi:hypothetical protein